MTDVTPTGLLTGKVVVVSGVGPGLGRSICLRAAAAGASVVLAARTDDGEEHPAHAVLAGARALPLVELLAVQHPGRAPGDAGGEAGEQHAEQHQHVVPQDAREQQPDPVDHQGHGEHPPPGQPGQHPTGHAGTGRHAGRRRQHQQADADFANDGTIDAHIGAGDTL